MIDYTSEQRAIFQYHDGNVSRWADPDTINRRLLMACPDMNEALKHAALAKKENPSAEEQRQALVGEEKSIAAARTAFGMPCNPEAKTPAEYGATEAEVRTALQAFLDFLKKKESSAAASPTSSPPSAFGRTPSSPITKRTSASP